MKLLVFNAVITSKVLYGLETLEPTEAAGRLLDTFQLKGLRKILKLHTTFVQHNNSNDMCIEANETLNAPSEGPGRQIKPLTKILEDRKLKLLGHVLRRDRQHRYTKLHSPQDLRSHGKPNTEDEAAGRPRQFWTTNNMSKAWEVVKTHDATEPQIPFDKNNRSMRERIIEQAQWYQSPFNKGNPIWNMLCESFAQCDAFTQSETFARRDTFTQCETFAQCDTFTQCETFAQWEVFATWEDFFSIIHHQAVSEALGSW